MTTRTTPQVEQQRFVEQLGLLAEESGMPRMAGRVLGVLLLAGGPELSFGDLVERLRASKGSISTNTRLLIQLGLIERVSNPGDRRDYFRLCADAWTRFLKQRVEMVGKFRRLAQRALPLLDGEPVERRARLEAMYELYSYWERESVATLTRWEERHPQD